MSYRLPVISCIFLASSAQILQLTPGKISGFDYRTKKGPYAEVFLNIPFASAPVGGLRFEKPTPPKPWRDIRDGTKFGSSCHPITPDAVVAPEQPSEDCLTLNLIRPKKEAPSPGFPIMFWVHGGGYESGSAVVYGYKGLADIYIPRDIIIVTIQYRLAVYDYIPRSIEMSGSVWAPFAQGAAVANYSLELAEVKMELLT
ncbi:hypothetical protein ANCCAN_19484 [Ancylostoma caninum]|uniref:Carboxylesterase type B domain-containing protein n=1 Tax=Ancylostoma caninum TaxID=29170 RepID=A0A368FV44_ANCCA|nr:hypothetical protein ANCCAN_19484 [Ancylostoma caninum]